MADGAKKHAGKENPGPKEEIFKENRSPFLRMHKDLAPISTKIRRIDTSFPQLCNKKGKNAKRTKKIAPAVLPTMEAIVRVKAPESYKSA